jgi:hypothetical protein
MIPLSKTSSVFKVMEEKERCEKPLNAHLKPSALSRCSKNVTGESGF